MPLLLAAAGVLGLAIGSFLNVVIHRVPRGQSIARPSSACPRCSAPIRARDKVPVISWLALRGRCGNCGDRISVRYPLVEVGTALAFVAVAIRFGPTPLTLSLLFLAAASIALTLIDLDVRRLPDAIVLPSYVVTLAGLVATSALSDDWSSLWRGILAGTALFVGYFLVLFAYPKGMGFGDVKLSGVLGLTLGYLGWGSFAVGAFAGFLLGGLFAIGLILTRRASRGSAIPFGPWMLLGTWVGIFAGQSVWDAYLGLVGLA